MTSLAQRISETPMAPYADVLLGMKPSEMRIVVGVLEDAIRETKEAKRKIEDEFLAKKMAEFRVSPETHELVDWLRLTPEEAADERTRYILGER